MSFVLSTVIGHKKGLRYFKVFCYLKLTNYGVNRYELWDKHQRLPVVTVPPWRLYWRRERLYMPVPSWLCRLSVPESGRRVFEFSMSVRRSLRRPHQWLPVSLPTRYLWSKLWDQCQWVLQQPLPQWRHLHWRHQQVNDTNFYVQLSDRCFETSFKYSKAFYLPVIED